jgi:hypothetical protein
MKTNTLKSLAMASALALTTTLAQAWDFTYGYRSVYDANADAYIVATPNAKKYNEGQTVPETYWGPTANGVAASVTSRFTFAAPTTEIFLRAQTTTFNHGSYYANSSLWASTDGSSWQLLLDNPKPSGTVSQLYYNQDVPGSLLGATEFWVQARMDQTGVPATWFAEGQFSRYDPATTQDVFHMNVLLVPEPSAFGLAVIGGLAAFCARGWRHRRSA